MSSLLWVHIVSFSQNLICSYNINQLIVLLISLSYSPSRSCRSAWTYGTSHKKTDGLPAVAVAGGWMRRTSACPGHFILYKQKNAKKSSQHAAGLITPPASSRHRLAHTCTVLQCDTSGVFSESLVLMSNGERRGDGISLLAWQHVKPFWWKNILHICSVYHACQWWAGSVTCTATCGRQRSVKDGVLEASKSASMVRHCCERGWPSGCWRIYR